MPYLQGYTTVNISTQNFKQLRTTSMVTDFGTCPNTSIYVGSGANITLQIDSNATGTVTTYQSTILTGNPAGWIPLGQIDPSRIWIRGTASSTCDVTWHCIW